MRFCIAMMDEETESTVMHDFKALTWYSALNEFVKFLKGAGFNVKDNSVGINLSNGHVITETDYLPFLTTFEQE